MNYVTAHFNTALNKKHMKAVHDIQQQQITVPFNEQDFVARKSVATEAMKA